jgi:hypothetical protein
VIGGSAPLRAGCGATDADGSDVALIGRQDARITHVQ